MSARTALIDNQRSWAAETGRESDTRAYLLEVTANLFQPLSPGARMAFERGSGSELLDTPTRPAKMKALHSSSALAVNVFDYWSTVDSRPLARALGINDATNSVVFEAQYPTGLGGNPPNLDVVLQLESGGNFAIESKFSEWLTPKSAGKRPFKEKYFEDGVELWAGRGLPLCQRTASQMQVGSVTFRYLDAPQLLKHALGLATNLDRTFSLHYIYYDWPGEESVRHLAEIDQFASGVDAHLGFTSVSYQQLYSRLCEFAGTGHSEYMQYLNHRYFRLQEAVSTK